MKFSSPNLVVMVLCVVLISSLCLPVIKIEALHPRVASTVAYLYYDDLASAEEYEALLHSFGITVYLENVTNIFDPGDLVDAQLVIIGDDTEYAWETLDANTIFSASLNSIFLGLGEGGYQFFGALGWLDIGYPNGWHGSRTALNVSDPSHQIFNHPISVDVPTDRLLELYTSSDNVGIYMPSPPPDVTLLGKDTVWSTDYVLLQEEHFGTFVLWGFTGSPSSMTQTGQDLFINVVLYLTGWETPLGFSAAYVYATDLPSAQSFQNFLETHSIACDLVVNSSAAGWDYSSYGVIIIANDTGFESTWTPEEATWNIPATGKPILGLGFGGSSFFGEIGSILRWDYGWQGNENSIYVVKPDHQIFHYPNLITIPLDKTIQLYTTTKHIGIYRDPPHFTDTPLGREPSDLDHYPLIQENSNWVLWGFTGSPSSMTQTGQDLFINLVLWLHGSIIPEYSSLPVLLFLLLMIGLFLVSRKVSVRLAKKL